MLLHEVRAGVCGQLARPRARRLIGLLLGVLSLFSGGANGADSPPTPENPEAAAAVLFQRIDWKNIPSDELSSEGRNKDNIIRDTMKEHAPTALKTHFEAWAIFEDADIAFAYPNDPLLRVQVQPTKSDWNPNRLREYQIQLADKEYLTIRLYRAPMEQLHPQPGGCMCGSVHASSYAFRNGTLSRFGYMRSGELLDVSVAGERLAANLVWTHAPLPQAIFRAIAASVVMKDPISNTEATTTQLVQRYGPEAAMGFLRQGMNPAEAETVAGKPTRREDASTIYVIDNPYYAPFGGPDGAVAFTLSFQGGVLSTIQRDTIDYEPVRGSPSWLVQESGREDLSAQDAAYIQQRLRALLQAPQMFFRHCLRAARNLQQKQLLASDVPALLRAAFVASNRNLGLDQFDTEDNAQHLQAVLGPDCEALIAQRLQDQLRAGAQWPGIQPGESETSKEEQNTFQEDWQALLKVLPAQHPQCKPLILEALQGEKKFLRDAAYDYLDRLSAEQRRPFLRQGLSNPYFPIRRACLQTMREDGLTADDLPALRQALTAETDRDIRENLEYALESLTAPADAPAQAPDTAPAPAQK